jgi:SAM-dependent methyltransferase
MTPGRLCPALDESQYADWYPKRMGRSTQPEAATRALRRSIEHLRGAFPARPPLSVLGVGSGTGELDRTWAAMLAEHFPLRHYDAIEPNPEHVSALRRNLDQVSRATPGLETTVHACTVEQWRTTRSYHFIHMAHCVHWFADPVDSVMRARERLIPGGTIFIILQSERGVPRLYEPFMERFKGHHQASLTAETVSQMLRDAGCDHDMVLHDARLDVTDCLDRRPEGIEVLSFLLQCDLRQAEPTDLDELVAEVRRISVPVAGRWFLLEPLAAIELGDAAPGIPPHPPNG